MIPLDWYCALMYTKRFSTFLCFENVNGKFQTVDGDFPFVVSVMLLSCTLNFSVILSVVFHFCSFIYKAFSCIMGQSLFSKRVSQGLWPRPLFLLHTKGPWPPNIFSVRTVTGKGASPGSLLLAVFAILS